MSQSSIVCLSVIIFEFCLFLLRSISPESKNECFIKHVSLEITILKINIPPPNKMYFDNGTNTFTIADHGYLR